MVKRLLQIEDLNGSDLLAAISDLRNEVTALRSVVMKASATEQVRSENPENMTIKQVCKYLQINNTTLWKITKKGDIAAYRIGSRKFYKRMEVETLLLNGKTL